MNRLNYAIGSEEDIPEVEEMSPEEFEDIKKMIGAPTEQASGIRSIDKKMVSEPSGKSDADSIARKLFGKGIDELDEVELIQLQEYLDRLASKRKAPSIKMAEYEPGNYDPLIVEEYEKYKYDAEEQGQPVMSIDEFLRMARSQAMGGGIMRNMYGEGTGAKQQDKKQYAPPWEYGPYDDVIPKRYPDPFTARIESDKADRAILKDIQRGEYPLKKTGKNIDLDVEKIKQLIEKSKKEKIKKAKGGIAGVL